MITTKRQINTASDRFGGYAGSRIAPTYAEPDAPSDISSMKSYSPENNIMLSDPETAVSDIRIARESAPRLEERPAPLYTTLDSKAAAVDIPKRPEREKREFNREDIMPSFKTQRAAGVAPADDEAKLSDEIPVRRTRAKLSPRTKILLFVYVAVALVLAIAVIATGVSISNTAAKADALQSRISAQQSALSDGVARIAQATDPDTLRAKASEMGMVDATEATESITLVERVDYPQAMPHTNGFDEFMDWLSKL